MSDDQPSDKKPGDLTALFDLPKGDDQNFVTTISEDAPITLEGMDDLMSPMSPTSPGLGSAEGSAFTFSADPNAAPESLTEEALMDPIASLPPIDGDTLAAAAGTSEAADLSPEAEELLASPPSLPETAIGAAIAGALSTSVPSMDSVKNYSDHVAPAGPETAETPFSLSIEGALKPHECEALLSILSRENLGIREVELEPQFAAGRVLIPRISEYAGVLIIQALRNTTAKMRLGPSDRIFVSKDPDRDERLIYPPNPDAEVFINEEGTDHAETVVLTSADTIPGRKVLAAIDTLHTSMNLKSVSLAQPQSPLFQDAIERLKKQLKFQAHHRGANALVAFKYTLHPMEGQTMHKLVVEARAVRVEH